MEYLDSFQLIPKRNINWQRAIMLAGDNGGRATLGQLVNLVTKGWGHTHGWFQGQEILERLESRGLVKVDLEAHPKFYRLTKKGLSVYRELKLD